MRRLVERFAGLGTPHEDIAQIVGIHAETLRIHYREDLDRGVAIANAKVAGALFKAAMHPNPANNSARRFWLAVRAGWREQSSIEVTGKDGGPIRIDSARERVFSRLAAMLERKREDGGPS